MLRNKKTGKQRKQHKKIRSNLSCIRNNKGITLIALIITVIVLLILAGVTIAALTGENGLIDKSVQASFLTEYQNVKEQVDLYNLNIQIENRTKRETNLSVFPLGERIASEETEKWKEEKTALIEQIEEKTEESLENTILYWINFDELDVNSKHLYIIDASTGLLFCYEGHKYSGKLHHIPDNTERNTEIVIRPEFEDGNEYPILKDTGIESARIVRIKYSEDSFYKNYYSLDEGKSWQKYTGPFTVDKEMVVYAKSVNTITGAEAINSKEVVINPKAIGPEAYDGSLSTYYDAGTIDKGYKYMLVDPSAIGLEVDAHLGKKYTQIRLLDENEEILYESDTPGVSDGKKTVSFEILDRTKYLVLYCSSSSGLGALLYEIEVKNKPQINVIQKAYPELTSAGINAPYMKLTLSNSAQNSVEKMLYNKNNGTWKEYKGEEIRLEIGETIYAKNQFKNGEESEVVSQKCEIDSRAITEEAYDGSSTTYDNSGKIAKGYKYMLVDPSAIGVTVQAHLGLKYGQIQLLDENEEILYKSDTPGVASGEKIVTFEILDKTKYLVLYCSNTSGEGARLYEIEVKNKPQINVVQKTYPELTSSGINKPNMKVTLSTENENLVEKILYSKNNINWQEYNGEIIQLTVGETIYAKNKLKNGQESGVVSQKCELDSRAITEKAYDGLSTTYDNSGRIGQGYKYMVVDPSAIGLTVEAHLGLKYAQIRLLDENEEILYKSDTPGVASGEKTVTFEILDKTKYLVLYCSSSSGEGARLYEFKIVN